jgi:N-carbamoylputrescine amidase
LNVAVVQHRWRADGDRLRQALADGVSLAAGAGAQLVVLPELTLSRYPAFQAPDGEPARAAESLLDGATVTFLGELARRHRVSVQGSLYERADPDGLDDGLGFNTSVVVGPDGQLVGRTRKLHIPVTEGYAEHLYFRHGPSEQAFPVHQVPGCTAGLATPTCWDQWFPEVARLYALRGADVISYPTAIGSEPDHPDFDTSGAWRAVMIGHAIANGLFVIAANRTGDEGAISFYGSSFIADPYGRVLISAPRDEEAVLIADLDLDQRRDWLELFPFFAGRRPDCYQGLVTAKLPD